MAKEPGSHKPAFDLLSQACLKVLGPPVLPQIRYCLSTPSTLLNSALGIGGIPGGCAIEIIGDPGKGKTSLAISIVASAQQQGGWAHWADAERRLDRKFANMLGADLENRFLYCQPDNLEQYLGLLEKGIDLALAEQKTNPVPVVFVLDSVAVLGLANNGVKDFEKTNILPMSIPQQWTQFWQRKISKSMSGTNIYLLLLNHQRVQVDFFGHGPPKKRSPGGSMLGYMDSVKIYVNGYPFPAASTMGKHYNHLDSDSGAIQKFHIEKNSAGAPWREAEIPFFFHRGYDDALGCLRYLMDSDIGEICWSAGYKLRDGTKVPDYSTLVSLLQNPDWARVFKQWAAEVYHQRNVYQGP